MRIALVGDRSPGVRSHARIPLLVEALRERDGIALDPYWMPTDDVRGVAGFDGIWLVPGSPYRDEAGAVEAVRVAREQGIPFLGTCAGFQHMLLEYARHVCGLRVAHAENEPGAADFLLTPLACSLAGHEGRVRLVPGTRIEQIVGATSTTESYICSYGLNEAHKETLAGHGLVFSGHAEDGTARVAELPGHPFFLATLFQPELAGDGRRPHPVVAAFAAAVARHHAGRGLASAR
ncbi:CTP synthase C-terminal region-related (seleno)protein [Nonomuraea gerenzanensis]|uniref:CTP synthase C-terminal region-related (seleno)protein n=1 Tax=Nonomuraea gerenzanensis TaxID=93944 RepID=UPI001CD946DA|nr:gamma-glutamyl-gamma-aminobutyrate hydrolase family protein [Nonomuraea gerenzanensis]UBU18684.1 gamma-glutamyl-gamma-aminobutyrate hydrolase family protein [Nonomuraea gerenzanensis]